MESDIVRGVSQSFSTISVAGSFSVNTQLLFIWNQKNMFTYLNLAFPKIIYCRAKVPLTQLKHFISYP